MVENRNGVYKNHGFSISCKELLVINGPQLQAYIPIDQKTMSKIITIQKHFSNKNHF